MALESKSHNIVPINLQLPINFTAVSRRSNVCSILTDLDS